TLMFALSAQNRLDEESHQLIVFVAILFGVLSFAAFFYLIDYASRPSCPVSILTRVGDSGLAVLETVYPNPSLGQVKESRPFELAAPDRTVRHRGTSGIVMAVRVRTLLA